MFFLFKQKTAYEMRISDWSSDVCSSDLPVWNPDLVSTAGDTKAIAEKAAISRANQNQALRSRARSLEPSWAPQVNMNAIIENASSTIATNPKIGSADRKSTRLNSSH